MRISIIKKNAKKTWENAELMDSAARLGYEAEIVDTNSFQDVRRAADRLGDVSIWRSATASSTILKAIFLAAAHDKLILNQHLAQQPFASYKLYQQSLVERYTSLKTIPTLQYATRAHVLDAVKQGQLTYPFIQKPNLGSQGFGVSVIQRASDLARIPDPAVKYIYQPFVPNKYDYRLMVVGGVMLGAIKRIRRPRTLLNNIAQGASPRAVIETVILEQLQRFADVISPLFPLHIFAIDVLEDRYDRSMYFLEINTVPQWQGFQRATSIRVADKIISLGVKLHDRRVQRSSAANSVAEYYFDNLAALPARQQFHFLSRLWLWTGDTTARHLLDQHADRYIPPSGIQLHQHLKAILDTEPATLHLKVKLYHERRLVLAMYPRIKNFNHLLELALLARSVYGRDLTLTLERLIRPDHLAAYQSGLRNNPQHIAVLSSIAINYLYFTAARHSVALWQKIAVTCFDLSDPHQAWLQLYLITHAVINESRYYHQALNDNRKVYSQLLAIGERTLARQYHCIPLDIKLEFLVAARLCAYRSRYTSIILGEAAHSFSSVGNFLVDTLNTEARTNRTGFIKAEHSNVLFIMASTPPRRELTP